MTRTRHSKMARRVSAKTIRRTVASSTAIETGQRVADLERKLESGSRKYRRVTLARR